MIVRVMQDIRIRSHVSDYAAYYFNVGQRVETLGFRGDRVVVRGHGFFYNEDPTQGGESRLIAGVTTVVDLHDIEPVDESKAKLWQAALRAMKSSKGATPLRA